MLIISVYIVVARDVLTASYSGSNDVSGPRYEIEASCQSYVVDIIT
jgi:hypothetical protein